MTAIVRVLAAAALPLLAAPLAAGGVRAEREPYLSVRTGLRCAQCHSNRTGGGGRTEFGSIYAQTRLGMRTVAFRDRLFNDFISVGGNFRVLANGAVSQTTPRTSVEIEEANVQLYTRLVAQVLALYVDETVGPGAATTREAFALLEGLPLEGYLKAGKILLPYGLRLVDDAEFIRQRTGFTYDTPDLGVEVGIEPGPLSLFVALSNGTQGAAETNNAKQVTASAALIRSWFRVGASAARNDAGTSRRDVLGGFAGLNAGRLALLGELDLIRDTETNGARLEQLAGYVEGNFLPARGINVKATYGFLDPNRAIGENARIRVRLGVETFPYGFLQVSAFYVLLQDIPQATADRDRVFLTLHTHF